MIINIVRPIVVRPYGGLILATYASCSASIVAFRKNNYSVVGPVYRRIVVALLPACCLLPGSATSTMLKFWNCCFLFESFDWSEVWDAGRSYLYRNACWTLASWLIVLYCVWRAPIVAFYNWLTRGCCLHITSVWACSKSFMCLLSSGI